MHDTGCRSRHNAAVVAGTRYAARRFYNGVEGAEAQSIGFHAHALGYIAVELYFAVVPALFCFLAVAMAAMFMAMSMLVFVPMFVAMPMFVGLCCAVTAGKA